MFKNVASQSVTVLAIDTATGAPKTGDASNITLYYSGDGGGVTVFSTGSGHPSEDDATNAPGCYTITATQGETNYNRLNVTGKSSTSGIRVIPILNLQTVPNRFPTLVIDSAGLADANAVKVGPTGSGTTQTARDLGFALPAAAPNVNGGLPILSVSGTTLAYTVSTLTTYTGDTPQTGDAFARIGATGSGLTSLAPASTAMSTAQWTSARAGYLENLNVTDLVATRSDVFVRRNTAQNGSTAAIQLDGGASSIDNFYQWMNVWILSGTGAGQVARITSYTGSNKSANATFFTAPDNTSVFAILPATQAAVGWVDASPAQSVATVVWLNSTRTLSTAGNTGVWGAASRTLTAGTNIQLPSNGLANVTAWTVAITGNITGTVSGNAPASTALSTADWSTARAGYLDNVNNATLAAASFPTDPADESLVIAATDAIMTRIGAAGAGLTALGDARLANLDRALSALFTTAMAESYNADGSAPTPAQALMVIMQRLTEFSVASTTVTVKKLNGSTTALTLTLDDATSPTSSTRAT